MSAPMRLRLRARDGRAVLVGAGGREYDPARLRFSRALVDALHEWAEVAERIAAATGSGGAADDLVTRRGRQLAQRLAVETGGEVAYADPVSGELRWVRQGSGGQPDPPPTPWATGLAVSVIVAGIMAVILVVVTVGLVQINPLLGVGVNVAIAAGFAPSIWIGRRVLVWRWVAYGLAAGIAAAWIALLLSLLG